MKAMFRYRKERNQDKIIELERSNRLDRIASRTIRRFLIFPIPEISDACQEING